MSSAVAMVGRRPRWTWSAIAWLLVLSIMAGFQTWRGAYVDGILFFAIVAMLLIDRFTGGRIRVMKQPVSSPKVVTLAITGTLALVLVFAPRHSWIDFVTMVAIGVTVLVLAWEPATEGPTRPATALNRSSMAWSILGVGLCVWEATAFVLSVSLPDARELAPTVSVLLDPVLENFWGRILFVGLWLAGGLGLLRFWRKK